MADIWTITPHEAELARKCVEMCLACGADSARVSLNKSMMDLFLLLNGEVDKVTHSGDRSLTFNIFAGGKYGTFSTNRLDIGELQAFIVKAIGTVALLAEDPFRKLPDTSRTVKNALTGREMGIYDAAYEEMTPEKRAEIAAKASVYKTLTPEGCTIVSEETEYSDSVYDLLIVDSDGLECRHTETSFEIGIESTIMDSEGNRYSGFWWDSQPFLKDLSYENAGQRAYKKASSQIGPIAIESAKMNMVLSNEVSSRVLTPVLSALSAFSIHQKNSFLVDSIGKQIFPSGLNVIDRPLAEGCNGARMFDSEGVVTKEMPIIENGVVKNYFINTYMAGKMDVAPTVEDSIRACVLPYGITEGGQDAILDLCGSGILVTGFNGGNCNAATGDFSYGVEGFTFSEGKIGAPVHEMLITGNIIDLWNNLVAAGTDTRSCMARQIPTLAFKDVDFSA